MRAFSWNVVGRSDSTANHGIRTRSPRVTHAEEYSCCNFGNTITTSALATLKNFRSTSFLPLAPVSFPGRQPDALLLYRDSTVNLGIEKRNIPYDECSSGQIPLASRTQKGVGSLRLPSQGKMRLGCVFSKRRSARISEFLFWLDRPRDERNLPGNAGF